MSRPVLDEADALNRVGGDRELLAFLIQTFAEEKQGLLANLEAARAARDASKLKLAAHSLKGGAGTLGGQEMWDLAYVVELKAQSGEWDGMDEAIEAMLAALERLQPELDRLAATP